MKIKSGFVMREFAGKTIVVPVGETSKSFNGIIKLNATGRFLWQLLQEDVSEIDMIAAMTDTYDVDIETARNDICAFLDVLRGAGLLQ